MKWITLFTALVGYASAIAGSTEASEEHELAKRSPRVQTITCDGHPVSPAELMKDFERVKDCKPFFGQNKELLYQDCTRSIWLKVPSVDTFQVDLHVKDFRMINRPGVTKELQIVGLDWSATWETNGTNDDDLDHHYTHGKCIWTSGQHQSAKRTPAILAKRSPRVQTITCDGHPVNSADLMNGFESAKLCDDVLGPNKKLLFRKCRRSIYLEVPAVNTFRVTLYVKDFRMINKPGVTRELQIADIEWFSSWLDGTREPPDSKSAQGKCTWTSEHHALARRTPATLAKRTPYILAKRAPRVQIITCDGHPIKQDDLMRGFESAKKCDNVFGRNKELLYAKCKRSIYVDVPDTESFQVTLHVNDFRMINRPGVARELEITDIEWWSTWNDGTKDPPDLKTAQGKCQWSSGRRAMEKRTPAVLAEVLETQPPTALSKRMPGALEKRSPGVQRIICDKRPIKPADFLKAFYQRNRCQNVLGRNKELLYADCTVKIYPDVPDLYTFELTMHIKDTKMIYRTGVTRELLITGIDWYSAWYTSDPDRPQLVHAQGKCQWYTY